MNLTCYLDAENAHNGGRCFYLNIAQPSSLPAMIRDTNPDDLCAIHHTRPKPTCKDLRRSRVEQSCNNMWPSSLPEASMPSSLMYAKQLTGPLWPLSVLSAYLSYVSQITTSPSSLAEAANCSCPAAYGLTVLLPRTLLSSHVTALMQLSPDPSVNNGYSVTSGVCISFINLSLESSPSSSLNTFI